MGRVVNVDWADLHKVGEEFLEQANTMNKLSDDINDIFDSLDKGWMGYDADIYKRKGKSFSRRLKRETYYLSVWHSFLTKSSNKYVGNVENGLLGLNRIDEVFKDENK